MNGLSRYYTVIMSKYRENKFQGQELRKNLVSKMCYIAYIWSDQSAYSDRKISSQLTLQLFQEIKIKLKIKYPQKFLCRKPLKPTTYITTCISRLTVDIARDNITWQLTRLEFILEIIMSITYHYAHISDKNILLCFSHSGLNLIPLPKTTRAYK